VSARNQVGLAIACCLSVIGVLVSAIGPLMGGHFNGENLATNLCIGVIAGTTFLRSFGQGKGAEQ